MTSRMSAVSKAGDPGRIEDYELAELLRRLDGMEASLAPDDAVTIRDVCELTGHSEREVKAALEELREEDLRARLATALRELEAPLYAVERPGFASDPLSAWARTKTLQEAFPTKKPKSTNKTLSK